MVKKDQFLNCTVQGKKSKRNCGTETTKKHAKAEWIGWQLKSRVSETWSKGLFKQSQKMLYVLTSIRCVHHPNAGQNIKQKMLIFILEKLYFYFVCNTTMQLKVDSLTFINFIRKTIKYSKVRSH